MSNSISIQVTEPSILTANTFNWSPRGNAGGRRSAEVHYQAVVAEYFKALGLTVSQSGDTVTGENDTIHARFEYSESCKNVYKSLCIHKNGKKSNITALRKLAASL